MSQQLQLLSNILLMSNLRMVLLNTLKLDELMAAMHDEMMAAMHDVHDVPKIATTI